MFPTLHDCCSGMEDLEQEPNALKCVEVQVYLQVEILE